MRRRLVATGEELLAREDPVRALESYRDALRLGLASAEVRVGLGRCHLLLGDARTALAYACDVLADDPDHDAAIALEVRALMRARRFGEALERSRRAITRGADGVETLAAHASALFRTQNNGEAERRYREVLRIDPLHAEAHLRLGSGLTPAREVEIGVAIERGVAAARRGRHADAIAQLRRALDEDPGNPVAHRLLGEVLYAERAATSMATRASEYRWLRASLPAAELGDVPIDEFVPRVSELDGERREVVRRGVALFASQISRLVAMGGRHDLIPEDERTTDDPSRANLRGRRTFDGRVWDDVRGIGGLRAATGIEALDEALGHGFDTLAHELAHQVHLYALPHRMRVRIRELYDRAVRDGKCLDFYAASNDAEYFGQGVEAFSCLGKRPGYEVTHGHTRFELMRVDPELHDLIASIADFDPLDRITTTTAERSETLRAAIAVALRSGRPDDALTAAELLTSGVERDVLVRAARRAQRLARSY